MQRDYRDSRDIRDGQNNGNGGNPSSIGEMSDEEVSRTALRLMSAETRCTFTPKELRKYVGENLDKLPPVAMHHYPPQQQQQQQQLYPPPQRHPSFPAAQPYNDFPGTIGGINTGNSGSGGMSMDAMASELQSYSTMINDYESSGGGLSRSASGSGGGGGSNASGSGSASVLGQNLWSDFNPIVAPSFSSPPSSPLSGSSSPSSPKMSLPVAKKSAPVSSNQRASTGTGPSGSSSSASSASQSSMPLKSSQSSTSPHYPSTPRAQPRTDRSESVVDHFENLERSIRTDYHDRQPDRAGMSVNGRDSNGRGSVSNGGFLTHLPDKTRTLQNVLEEIDREFGDCNPELKEKLRQITLLYRPEYQEILQQAFTPKERDSIYKSMQPNHLELYKDLYKTFFDLHRRRSALTAAVLKNDPQFKPVQDFLQSRQQILGDLLRKYRTILEKSEE